MTKEQRQLERLALAAHAAGTGWRDFWAEHGDAVQEAEPYCLHRWRRLRDRLMHLVLTGDEGGQYGIGDDEPWLGDEQPETKPPDAGTAACFQGTLFPIGP